ncbi:MAG: beta-glucosidase, partial [Acidobacteriota bacterium]
AAVRTAEISRLGINTKVVADGPAGQRISPNRDDDPNTYYATAFPISTLLASSWDTDLVYEVGQAMGNEVLEYGVDTILGPGMNLHRNPLCGRNFEYYSEDPLITGKMAAAIVRGIQSQGVGSCIKHYAVNNQETNRGSVDAIASQRALREIYLEGFRIAVQEGNPWTVMSSYNKLNGPYTSESHDLLTKVLRDDWGFEGYVMTDWGGGSDPVAQMQAGNDLLMPGNVTQSETILQAVKDGSLDESVLDGNVKRILSVVLKTPRSKGYVYSDKPDLKAHAEVARKAGAEGMVLLKNLGAALPVTADVKNVAVFGKTSYEIITGGTGSGDVNEAYSVSLIEGLENSGYSIDSSLQSLYSEYLEKAKSTQQGSRRSFFGAPPIPEMSLEAKAAADAAGKADMALITIGRNSGEGGDRKADAGDFYLTDTEKALIQTVSSKFREKGKKSIVVLNVGGVIETASWRGLPDAILLAWQPGQETGNAIVDVLSGRVNPSGKLADTFPMTYDDVPSAKNFPGIELPVEEGAGESDQSSLSFIRSVPSEVVYEEDIYVGYRYFDTFDVPVAFPFGFGLSYTEFQYDNAEASAAEFDGSITATVRVTNAGKVAGREVVEVYLNAPEGRLEKPSVELVAFGKTKLLQPGESQELNFVINERDLASFDEEASAWIAEPGSYTLKIGASSRDIRQSVTFKLEDEINVKAVSDALVPEREISRLSR